MKLKHDYALLFRGIILTTIVGVYARCKVMPGSPRWPSPEAWSDLNKTLSGALIQATPPAAPCHLDQPSYNNESCAAIQKLWTSSWSFHTENPISNAYENWNNDTCLPRADTPCSGEGYPVYVINATTAAQVSTAVNFARTKNIRLIVKGTGHCFLGRSVAPYSLSIWTRHLKGIKVNDGFRASGPKCSRNYPGPSLTEAAGTNHGEAFAEADKHGLMIHVGGGPTVGIGGYLTGGGHSILSSQKGLAADAVLQMKVVTPNGHIRVVDECNNSDLYWAIRGGGGSTFGVVTEFTYQAWPAAPITTYTFGIQAASNDTTNEFWEVVSYLASQYPKLADAGLMSYGYPMQLSADTPAQFGSLFIGVNMTATTVRDLFMPIEQWINITHTGKVYFATNSKDYKTLYSYWAANPDTGTKMGIDVAIGSRLLDEKALADPRFGELMQEAGYPQLVLVGEPGVHAKAGDFNAVNPSWRRAYVHSITATSYPPLNRTASMAAHDTITNIRTKALRYLAPDSGS